jgi:hydroxybutyrate-dimer hydrolase
MLACFALAFCGPALADDEGIAPRGDKNRLPRFISGTVIAKHYPTDSTLPGDDLLTGGLGKTGITSAVAPGFVNALAPTADELRRRAFHTNYRAVMDPTSDGGFGRFYGPNVGNPIDPVEGKIPGWEYLAYADDGSGRKNVTLMVQVPDHFDVNKACIVTGTSSGSRGVYGAVGTSGEWGLKRGCAVADTDGGKGSGLHDLMSNSVGLIDGTRTSADVAGASSHFTARLSDGERSQFNAAWPNRVAYKHAHSQQNPEQDWGLNTLQAVRFAFWVLNEKYGEPRHGSGKAVALDKRNTIVIASSISNGGAGALQAAEQDRLGLIDGVAITEPNAQPGEVRRLRIQQGSTLVPTIGKPLYDYFTYANIYQPCAALAVAGAPAFAFLAVPNAAGAANRCAALAEKGLVSGNNLGEQATDALNRLRAYGWLPDSDVLHASHYRFATNAIAVTYSNAHGRFSVADNLCGFSFANTDATGIPVQQNATSQASIFATGNGVPPTTGVNIVYNASAGGPLLDLLAKSPSAGTADFALDGALCHRALATGVDPVTGAALSGDMKKASNRVRKGVDEVELSGRLNGKPAIIVHGRSDALVPVNHSSRAYFGKTHLVDAHGNRNLRYVEVTNAQHFDAFLPGGAIFGGYENRYVPLHVYFIRAMDWMYEHLSNGKPLPPSQVVRTLPRGGTPGTAPALGDANVPEILDNPAAGERITFDRSTLYIPD